MSTRQKRRERMEADILEASVALLQEHGIEGLTVSRIAKAIDYTPGALYRYYPSKDAIVTELYRAFIVQLEADLRALLDALPGDPGPDRSLAALVLTSEAWLGFAVEHPARFRLFALGLADPRTLVQPEHAKPAVPAYLSLFATLSGLFADAVRHGVLRDDVSPPNAAIGFALALMGPLQLDKLKAHAPPSLIDVPAIARGVADGLLVGWGADPALLARTRAVLHEG